MAVRMSPEYRAVFKQAMALRRKADQAMDKWQAALKKGNREKADHYRNLVSKYNSEATKLLDENQHL